MNQNQKNLIAFYENAIKGAETNSSKVPVPAVKETCSYFITHFKAQIKAIQDDTQKEDEGKA